MRAIMLSVVCLLVATSPAMTALPTAEQTKVRRDVLAAVEIELDRLSKQAGEEPGPVYPRPSSEVAFLILTGLATQGCPVKEPAVADLRQLGIAPSDRTRPQLFAVADDAWIVIRAHAIQDKAGSWTSRRATLYRRQGEKWVERGSGSTAIDGVSLP